ncbi:MAG: hypothetical protein WCK77_22055 [Verrucomicrobiota bacterium]
MKILVIAFALIGIAYGENSASFGLWIVDSQPFAESVKLTVNELQLEGFSKVAPDLSFGSIASVEMKDFMVPLQRTEGRGDMFHKVDGVLVKLQLGPEQVQMVSTLLRANIGKRVLLRLGLSPIATAEIHMITSLDGTGTKHINFTNLAPGPRVGPQIRGAEGDKYIYIHYMNNKDAEDIRALLSKLIQPKAEQPVAGQPATQPADMARAKDQPTTPTSKDGPR